MEPRLLLIVNGTPTTDWPAVGQVGGASGTLIAGQYVLTAAHCASSTFTVNGTTYSTAQIYRHPSYDYDALGTDSANDIAVLKLSTEVTAVTPIPILRSTPTVGGQITLAGDWDGDGVTTVGLYDPKTGYFYLHNSNTTGMGEIAFFYGEVNAGWKPVVGDWDHDGRDTVGLYDPHMSVWYLTDSLTTGYADVVFGYGPSDPGWLPVIGDWDGPSAGQQAGSSPAAEPAELRAVIAQEVGRTAKLGDLDQTLDQILPGPQPAIGQAEIDAVLAGRV